ncbi:MAG: ankyrin repeat domain-containing protein [Brevinema sp.]
MKKSLRFLIAFCKAGIVFNPCFLYSVDFHRAVELNMVPEVMKMVNEGADVNAKDRMGYTALHIASWNGNNELVEYLLRLGANPNVITPSGNTPLKFASPSVRRLLLQYGAFEPTTPPTAIFIERAVAPAPAVIPTPIVSSPPPRAITRVVSNFISNIISNTVIVTNIEYPKASYAILSNLTPQGSASLHAWDTNGDNALHRAAKIGDLVGSSNLIAMGINPLSPNNTGDTPLFMAVDSGNLDLIQFLVEKIGADVNQVNRAGETPSMRAKSNPPVLEYLTKMGGNPDAAPVVPSTPRTITQIKVEEVYADDGAYLDDFRAFEPPQEGSEDEDFTLDGYLDGY